MSTTPLSDLLNRRNQEGLSGRELGRRAGIGESTGTQYLGGRHPKHPSREVLEKIATVLPVTVTEMQAALDLPVDQRRWNPPAEVHTFNRETQDALSALIRAIGRERSSDDRQSEAEKSPHLHADDQDRVTLAARRIHGPKGIIDPSQETAGEENQDPGGWDEA
ncbi:helix-turn-helix transcriptional regulator [Cutibacterium avidum]|uniref:helix-turn-helix domain-containing protein n=1 Tax=Cutibacterium avidum TaxID=33010 RepID=UPI00281033D1|nr:helix-turn-helix transcriptional regulator [Cutibacterium avidum]MDQ9075856.1 helix-turn-helix transcriptional regulator [Cutibacterium avidum]MDU4679042.1 helix-turn-helix transcriptional regulator [Cutibacterium avidum]